MAVTLSPRLGITRWSDSAVDPITRAQLDADHAALDNLAARDEQGTTAARPAPGIRGRYYFATDATALYRDTGAAWTQIATTSSDNFHSGHVSVSADAVTPAAPYGGAALGVTRNASLGGVFLALNNTAGAPAGVQWGIGTWSSGEFVVGKPATSGAAWFSTPPLFLITPSGQVEARGQQNYFGTGAANSTGVCVTLGDFGSTTQGKIMSQSNLVNCDLLVAGQGTGGLVWLQPNSDTTKGLKVGTTGSTFLQAVAIAAGGLDVTGSPSAGYTSEVRSPVTTASAAVGFSTLGAGTPTMYFDHRATANTGQWYWRNGTAAASNRMALDSAGVLYLYSGATAALTLNPTAGSVTPHAEVTLHGDQSNLTFVDGAGVVRGLFGLRSDISGNVTDLVAYSYNGGFSFYPTANGTNAFQVRSDGSVRMEVAAAGGANQHSIDVYGSPNVGYSLLRAHTNWGDGNNGGLLLELANAVGTIFAVRPTGKLFFGASPTGSLTSTTATAGAAALPANPRGFLTFELNGTDVKMPYYNV